MWFCDFVWRQRINRIGRWRTVVIWSVANHWPWQYEPQLSCRVTFNNEMVKHLLRLRSLSLAGLAACWDMFARFITHFMKNAEDIKLTKLLVWLFRYAHIFTHCFRWSSRFMSWIVWIVWIDLPWLVIFNPQVKDGHAYRSFLDQAVEIW